MNNIRKIIKERLENVRNDFLNALKNGNATDREIGELQYTVATYQDCLNLMQPRTEQDILNDFEKLGWEVADGYNNFTLRKKLDYNKSELMYSWLCYISIDKENKTYSAYKISAFATKGYDLTMQEHKLLSELFEVIF